MSEKRKEEKDEKKVKIHWCDFPGHLLIKDAKTEIGNDVSNTLTLCKKCNKFVYRWDMVMEEDESVCYECSSSDNIYNLLQNSREKRNTSKGN